MSGNVHQVLAKCIFSKSQQGTRSTFPSSAPHNLKSNDEAAKRLLRTAAQLAVDIFTTDQIQNYIMTADGRRVINNGRT